MLAAGWFNPPLTRIPTPSPTRDPPAIPAIIRQTTHRIQVFSCPCSKPREKYPQEQGIPVTAAKPGVLPAGCTYFSVTAADPGRSNHRTQIFRSLQQNPGFCASPNPDPGPEPGLVLARISRCAPLIFWRPAGIHPQLHRSFSTQRQSTQGRKHAGRSALIECKTKSEMP